MRPRLTIWLGLSILIQGSMTGCWSTRQVSSPTPVGLANADPLPAIETPISYFFREVAAERGINFRLGHGDRSPLTILETLGAAAAWLDYDGDGRLDLFFGGESGCALYQQQPDGRFVEVARQAGLTRKGFWQGCAVADYDNDGDADLFLAGYEACALYRNNGKGVFTEMAGKAGLSAKGWNSCATFGDVNRDGWLDLFVGRYVDFGPHAIQYCLHRGILTTCGPRPYDPQFGTLYRNNRDGTFTDVTRAWGLSDAHGKVLGALFSDLNDDGWPDLYVANDEMPGDLFLNQEGRLRNVGVESGTAYTFEGNTQAGMGVDAGDFDRDGLLDLLVGTYQKEVTSLYRNLGDGTFQEESMMRGLGEATFPNVVFGAKFLDYDLDGWLDILLTTGHTQSNIKEVDFSTDYPEYQQLFHNRGDGNYEDVSRQAAEVFARPIVGRSAACGDLDRDGDLDVAITDLEGRAWLLENQAPKRGRWLSVRLIGMKSNRDGLNARLTVEAGGRRLIAEAQTGGGFFAAHEPRVHMGLGQVTALDRLEVRWPSGQVDRFSHLPLDARITVREASKVVEVEKVATSGGKGTAHAPAPTGHPQG